MSVENELNGKIGGYFITPLIQEILEQSPDIQFRDKDGRTISLVFGLRRGKGDPPYSAFCRILRANKEPIVLAAGGITPETAIKSLERGEGTRIYDSLVAELRERQNGS